MRLAQHDALPSTFDQALLLPGAENPAHRMQCGACHLGDVLTADWKVDLDTTADFLARLFRQPQKSMTDALVAWIKDALRIVIDPELGHNIVDLGFVYDITVVDGAARVPGVGSVEVVMTFEPPWTPSLIDPSARAALGFAAVN